MVGRMCLASALESQGLRCEEPETRGARCSALSELRREPRRRTAGAGGRGLGMCRGSMERSVRTTLVEGRPEHPG